jgi:hypothetical protein
VAQFYAFELQSSCYVLLVESRSVAYWRLLMRTVHAADSQSYFASFLLVLGTLRELIQLPKGVFTLKSKAAKLRKVKLGPSHAPNF